ncbi:MAG: hypothetical protein ACJAVA_000192 [Flavobacteriaceae bacterium]|jgi:hypothetical protein
MSGVKLMINCKNKDIIKPEFELIQLHLLLHKYLYYEKYKPMLDDCGFDMVEQYSITLAKNLGFRADKYLGPEENEKHHVHWMIGFNCKSIYWEETKIKYKL